MKITRHTFQGTRLLSSLTLIVMSIFVIRLFHLQVVQHGYYKDLAAKGQTRQWVLPAERGEIYMLQNGEPVRVVLNASIYTVWTDPKVLSDASRSAIASALREIAGGNIVDNLDEVLHRKDTRYQVLAKNITYKQAQLLKEKDFYGVGFERGVKRVYPEGQLGSHVLGFVNYENKGQYGVEGGLDDRLRGQNGLLRTVADVRNVPLTVGKDNINVPAVDGDDIVLTIDRSIQAKAEQVLAKHVKKIGADRASVVVMDPSNGHIMAMANVPTYNPEKLGEYGDLSVFNNASITTPIEAGSVIKSFTIASGLDAGVITPSSRYYNSGKVQVGDRTIKNASQRQLGSIDMQTAFEWSLNTGMIHILGQMGGGAINQQSRDVMYDYFYNKFGLGKSTGIELSGESDGIIVGPREMQGNAVRYSNMSFGQGMNVTMIQVVAGLSAITNGGQFYTPTVVAGVVDQGGSYIESKKSTPRQVISKEAADTASEMIYKARQRFYAGADKKGYYIGGKTGTAQVIRNGEYIFEETIATYAGFGGEIGKTPRYVMMVQVSGDNMNLHGDEHALPIFTDMSNWLIHYLKLQPER